jgi:hypothetical protein
VNQLQLLRVAKVLFISSCSVMSKLLTSRVHFQGYWMVKRAVGTKACLLGKAVTCSYLRKDNFLEVLQSS